MSYIIVIKWRDRKWNCLWITFILAYSHVFSYNDQISKIQDMEYDCHCLTGQNSRVIWNKHDYDRGQKISLVFVIISFVISSHRWLATKFLVSFGLHSYVYIVIYLSFASITCWTIFSLLQQFQSLVRLAPFITSSPLLALWQSHPKIEQAEELNDMSVTKNRFLAIVFLFIHSVWSLVGPSSTRGSVLPWRCRCPITVPGGQRTRRGSSVPGTGLRWSVAFLFLNKKKVVSTNSLLIKFIYIRRQAPHVQHCSCYKPPTIWNWASRIHKVQNCLRWVAGGDDNAGCSFQAPEAVLWPFALFPSMSSPCFLLSYRKLA